MTTQHIRRTGLVATFLLGSVAVSSRVAAQQAGIMVGASAPDAEVQTLGGETVHLSELTRGRPAVLEFWATWCPLCKALEPSMAAAREKHGDHVTFVSVGVRDNQTPEAQKAYVEEHMLGGSFVFDRTGAAVKAFQAPHTSFVVVLDAAGKVVYTGVGPDQDIEAALGHVMMGSGVETSPRD